MAYERKKWLTTDYPEIIFEDTKVGRMKKELWDASPEEIEKVLAEYEMPSPSEIGKGGTYIQNTPRAKAIEKRKKNDIVIIPIGCSENHGLHNNTGLDTFMCTQIAEGVRRYTAKKGYEVNLAFPPLNYGGHPYHHLGMPGTYVMPEEVVRETLIYTMLGLWDDGYRKMIILNNHGHLWMLESALQEFYKRYQLPALTVICEWHRAVREFFYPIDDPNSLSTHFVHADEAETSVALYLFPDMVDMSYVQDAEAQGLCLTDGFFDKSVDPFRRPHRWSEVEGSNAIERFGTPEGVVGKPSCSTAEKAKRPIAAILKYLTLMIDDIREHYPPGEIPPMDKITMRTKEELAPFLKEPLSPGWKSVHELPRMGIFESC